MEKNRKKRQKTRFCSLSGGVIALIFALCLNLLSGCAPVSNGKAPSLLDYDIDVYRVLLREATGANTQAQNALSLCLSLLTSLRFGSEEDWTDERLAPIDEMMAYYYENGVLPRDPYPGIGDYCSVMDAPLLAVTTELVFERTDEERFHQYTLDLIPYCTKSTEEGGFVLKLSDSEWWPLEYAWKTVTEEDAWFTLNGSLFGMVCVEMLKNLTQDAGLTELSEKALAAYRNRMDAFLYPDGSWFKYSLNGPDGAYVVNRPEKVFIEINSLRALHILTGEQDYLDWQQERIEAFSNLYPVYLIKSGDKNTVSFLRSGPPHPYDIDIYSTTLEILDEAGNVLMTEKCQNRDVREVSGAVMIFEAPPEAVSYRLYARTNSIEDELLVEKPLKVVEESELSLEPVAGKWSFGDDAVSLEDNVLTIQADASEALSATVNFNFEEPVAYAPETYLVVDLDNLTEEQFAMTCYLYDENGVAMTRTMLPCSPGRNYHVLHYTGFKAHDWPLEAMKAFRMAIVTNQMQENSGEILLKNMYVCTNTAQLARLLSGVNFTDFWTTAD